MIEATFAHVSLVAENWESLADFYRRVFECEVVPPTRDLFGPELEAATNIPEAHLRGAHVRLPGRGGEGPTLEVFQYENPAPRGSLGLNAPGIAHLAFKVSDVAQAREEVIRHGGSPVGQVVTLPVAGSGRVTFAYVRDPEGNTIELQSWSD